MDATSMLVSLLPVVVGGVIGFASSLGGQWFIHGLQAKAEKQRRRSAKFEELMLTLHEFDHWLGAMQDYRVLGREDPKTISPLTKVHAICSLHFPQFTQQVEELVQASRNYESWMIEAGMKRIKAGGKQAFTDGHPQAYSEYLVQRNKLIEEMAQFARHELQ